MEGAALLLDLEERVLVLVRGGHGASAGGTRRRPAGTGAAWVQRGGREAAADVKMRCDSCLGEEGGVVG